MSKVVTFGEIILCLSSPVFFRFSQTNSFHAVYGGGESNVAVSLPNYGVPVDFVTRFPNNDIGQCTLCNGQWEGYRKYFGIQLVGLDLHKHGH